MVSSKFWPPPSKLGRLFKKLTNRGRCIYNTSTKCNCNESCFSISIKIILFNNFNQQKKKKFMLLYCRISNIILVYQCNLAMYSNYNDFEYFYTLLILFFLLPKFCRKMWLQFRCLRFLLFLNIAKLHIQFFSNKNTKILIIYCIYTELQTLLTNLFFTSLRVAKKIKI